MHENIPKSATIRALMLHHLRSRVGQLLTLTALDRTHDLG